MTQSSLNNASPLHLPIPFHISSPTRRLLWLGPNGTHTGFHTDAYDNLMTIIRGSKTYKLAHPHEHKKVRRCSFRGGWFVSLKRKKRVCYYYLFFLLSYIASFILNFILNYCASLLASKSIAVYSSSLISHSFTTFHNFTF